VPPWSRLPALRRIGLDYFIRAGIARPDTPAPAGIVDDPRALTDEAMHPAVRAFFVDTASQVLIVESRWAWWARWWWRLARRWFVRVGQLTPPLDGTTMHTAMVALDDAREGRPGARGVLRTHDDGAPMQVVAYAVVRGPDGPLLSVCFPTPLGALTGLLRVVPLGAHGVTLSARGAGAGVFLRAFGAQLRTPLGETMSLWPSEICGCPLDIDVALHPEAELVGAHAQTLFGAVMVRHRYWFVPRAVYRSGR